MTDRPATSEPDPVPGAGPKRSAGSGRSTDDASDGRTPGTSDGRTPGSSEQGSAPRTPWQHYIDLIRELDTERTAEELRTAGQRQGAQAAALEVERLAPLLIDQGAELSHLARRLRISQPKLTAELSESARSDAGAYELVVQATRLTARAGSYAREAHTLATRPRFLPAAPAALRNGAIYLGWALLGLVVQLGILRQNQSASFFLILFGIPVVTFLAGLISVSLFGRAPLGVERAGRSARAGVLICFGLFPAVMILYLVRHFVA